MKKRCISAWLLAVLMAALAVPTVAFSEEENASTEEPYEIRFLIGEQFSAPVTNELEVIKILEEETNTIINVTNVAQSDLEVKVQTALSSGDTPDVVEMWNYDLAAVYAANGLFLPMDEYAAKYTNLQRWWEKYPSIKKNTHFDDGKLYILPKIDTRVFLTHLTINQTWLDETGLTAPTNLDELYDTLTAFKEAYPDGTPFGVGMYTASDGIVNQILYAYDVQNGFNLYSVGETYTYGLYTYADRAREAFAYLAKLYADKLLDQQMFSITEDEVTKKISNNEVGVFVSWEMYELYGPGGSFGTNYVPMAALEGPDGKAHDRGTAPTGTPFFVTKGCTNPDAVMRLFDYIYSDQGVELLNWGIEGQTFVKENGEYAYTDAVLKHELGPSTGRYALGLCTPHFPCVSLKESEYAAVMPLTQEREKLCEGILYPDNPILTGTEEENERVTAIMTDVNKYVNESIPKFVIGEWNTDGDFDAFIAQLQRMGIEEAIQIKEEQFKRWNSR